MKPIQAVLAAGLFAAGCAAQRVPLAQSPGLSRNLAQGRISDVTLVRKQIGTRAGWIKAKPLTMMFLEGTIQGTLKDWEGRPAAGVPVRLAWTGHAHPSESAEAQEDSAEDGDVPPAVADAAGELVTTDAGGRYQVRFSVPVEDGKVELKGTLSFSPDWEEQQSVYGRAYEPWIAERPVELYYYKRMDLLAFSEGRNVSPVRLRVGAPPQEPKGAAPAKPRKQAAQGRAAELLRVRLALVKERLEKAVRVKTDGDALALGLDENAFFAPGSAALSEDGKERIARLARWMKSPGVTVRIEPGDLSRRPLGGGRLANVAEALKQVGALPGNSARDARDTLKITISLS